MQLKFRSRAGNTLKTRERCYKITYIKTLGGRHLGNTYIFLSGCKGIWLKAEKEKKEDSH